MNSTSDIRYMVEVASSSGGEHGRYDTHDDLSGFETYASQLIGSNSNKSQLYLYLEETQLNHRIHEDLDVLGYWKSHSNRFPKLPFMACDILNIPITTICFKVCIQYWWPYS